MAFQIENNYGTVTISERVLADIAGKATMESYGIVGMAAKNTADGLYELLGLENMSRGIRVESIGGNRIVISLAVFIDYGIRIAVVCENVIERVRYCVEKQTGLEVWEVNIVVRGMKA